MGQSITLTSRAIKDANKFLKREQFLKDMHEEDSNKVSVAEFVGTFPKEMPKLEVKVFQVD